MSDSVTRFSSRVENYAKFRPTYPSAVIDILNADCGLMPDSVVADVGSGTGILSKMLLENGNTVFGIEPNELMRLYAERTLWRFNNFLSVNATAEDTTMHSRSMDLVVAAQAFHWFDRAKAKREFARIVKPRGWVVLIWNERRVDSTPFLRDYEDLLLRYGTDYAQVRHENVENEIADFFSPRKVKLKSLENLQHFDLASLKGRTQSASYTPQPGDANFEPLFSELEKIFKTHAVKGKVTVEYDTRIYFGRLAHGAVPPQNE
jgi:SAM-dependent methyltransferase